MDDLTQIKGIGDATAKRLVAAGIASFAALAVATPATFKAIDKLPGSPVDWAEWVEQAASLAPPAPVDLEKATPDQVDDHAARIDAARARLDTAQATVANFGGIVPAAAEAELAAAQQALDALIGPGEKSEQSEEPVADVVQPDWRGEISAIGAMLGIGAPQAGEVPIAVRTLLTRLEEAGKPHNPPESEEGGGAGASGGGSTAPSDLVDGICLTNVIWEGKTHPPHARLALPAAIAAAQEADHAFRRL